MQNLVLLSNANHSNASRIAAALRDGLDGRYRVSKCETRTPGEVTMGLIPPGTDAVLVVGGDGTVNSVLSIVKGSKTAILPIPAGTANDFATEAGISAGAADRIEEILNLRATKRLDVIECGPSCFVTVGGFGIGATVTEIYERMRRRVPPLKAAGAVLRAGIYKVLTVFTVLFSARTSRRYRVDSDGFFGEIELAAAFVCNQKLLGGDLHVAPDAQNDDGQFDVLFVPKRSRVALLATLLDLSRNRPRSDFVRFRARRLHVTAMDGEPISTFGDGEGFAPSMSLDYRISTETVHVLTGHA